MVYRVVYALLCLALVGSVGCGNRYLKAGDSAAALGDWKTATTEYGKALANQPDSPELRTKYKTAKAEAVRQATTRARRLLEEKQFETARLEADYAAGLDEANAEAIALRTAVRRADALDVVRQARSATLRGNVVEALDLLEQARNLSAMDEVVQQVQALEPDVVAAAMRAGEALREEARATNRGAQSLYKQAIALFERAATIDPRQEAILTAARDDYERWAATELERLFHAGDTAVTKRDWQGAIENYQAAGLLEPEGRAQPYAHYASLVHQADVDLTHRMFTIAANRYWQATQIPSVRDTYAASQYELTDVRLYRVRLQSVLLKPTRPDGEPWVGQPSHEFASLLGAVVTLGAGPVSGKVVEALASLPEENTPTVAVELALQDGRRFRTAVKKGCYVSSHASFVFASNHFDERLVAFHVLHIPLPGEAIDVGTISMRLKDMLAKRPIPETQSLLGLELILERADDDVDGAVSGLLAAPNATNLAASPSVARHGATGYVLTRVDARIRSGEYSNTLDMDGAPDPRVVLMQSGQAVYQSPDRQDAFDATEMPQGVCIFVEPEEQLNLRLSDADFGGETVVIATPILGREFSEGYVQRETTGGSYVRLSFQERQVGP